VEGRTGPFMFHVNFPLPELEAKLPPTQYLQDSLAFYADTTTQWPGGWSPDQSPETGLMQLPKGARVIFEVPAQDVAAAADLAGRLQGLRDTHSSENRQC
jgi:hypothetical protein